MKTSFVTPSVALFLLIGLFAPAACPAAHTKAETHPPAADPPPAAAPDAADPGEAGTPKGALLACDAALPAGGLDAALASYQADNDRERRAARALAAVDLATARLEAETKEKIGPAAVDAVLHAARNATRKDLEEADVKVDGDRAVIRWKTRRPDVPMVRVDGRWRVSVAGILRDLGGDVDLDKLEASCAAVVGELRRTTDELAAGEYPNANLLERAVQQRMFRVLGEEQ